MSTTQASTLRERQALQARTAMLEAALTQLETKGVDDVSMGEIAQSAGVSLRTLYRYFPDRAALLQAAGEHLYATLGVPFEVAGPEDISASLLDAARRLSTRPELTRALVRTSAGRTARSGVRRQRVEAITAALRPLTDGGGPDEARWAVAVIAHLCSSASWVMVADETGMDDADAQRAVAWAIDRLVAGLQHDNGGPQKK